MRVLLTGAAGWLGRHLKPRLAARGHAVVGLDIAPSPWTDVVGTVADRALVARLFREHRFEAVIHAGALHKPDIARFPAQAFVDANVTGTLNLLEEAAAAQARFVFTSTTSLMISQAIRAEEGDGGGLARRERRAAGAAQHLRRHQARGGRAVPHRSSRARPALRRSCAPRRFFPEADDTHADIDGANLKANEFLYRRLSVEDCAEAHVAALERAPEIGFGLFVISAPTPFRREHAAALKQDAAGVIARLFPEAPALYARKGWRLPAKHWPGLRREPRRARAGLSRARRFRRRAGGACARAGRRRSRMIPASSRPRRLSQKPLALPPQRASTMRSTSARAGRSRPAARDRPAAAASRSGRRQRASACAGAARQRARSSIPADRPPGSAPARRSRANPASDGIARDCRRP